MTKKTYDIAHTVRYRAFKIVTITLALYSAIHMTPTFFAAESGGEESLFGKPSEFELERLAPRTELDMLSANLAGENISLADGGLTFSATDVSVPLNMAMSATISRSYLRLTGRNDLDAAEFGDWQLDLPRIEATVLKGDVRWTPNYDPVTACSQVRNPGPIMAALGQNIEQHEYWNGADLTIPGQGGGKLLSGDSNSNYQTKDNMKIECQTDANDNEYFIVRTPNGLTYHLKQRRLIDALVLVRKFKAATRKRLVYQVTDIEDRFGNKLSYQYQSGLLSSISYTPTGATQAQEFISLVYIDGKVDTVTSFGKTWQYQYSGGRLSKVIRPDDRFWRYEFPSFNYYAPQIRPDKGLGGSANRLCVYEAVGGAEASNGTMRVTNPYGAVVEFDYELSVHGRTEVPAHWMMQVSGNNSAPSYNLNSCYGNLGVTEKRLLIDGSTPYVWNYDYYNNGKHWNIEQWNPEFWGGTTSPNFNSGASYGNEKTSACLQSSQCTAVPTNLGYDQFDLRVLKITQPDNSHIKHFISKRWDHTDGKVVATQWFSPLNANVPLKTVKKLFRKGEFKGYSGLHDPILTTNTITISNQTLASQQVILQNGDSYTTNYTDYNSHGALLESNATNSFSTDKRYTKTAYIDDSTHWLINLPISTQISSDNLNWTTVKENTYHSSTGGYKSLLHQTKIMGRAITTNSQYHPDGNLKRVEYNGSNRYELFENYKRGKAQKVTLPCSTTNGCDMANASSIDTVIASMVVNDNGTIQSVTDFKENKTSYLYNDIGWLIQIAPADFKWSDTFISYDTVTTNDDGIAGSGVISGMLKQTITKGDYEKRTYLDGLLRPLFTREQDISDNSTVRYQRFEYDQDNRQVFAAFPSDTVNTNVGIRKVFDALGRTNTVTRTSNNAQTQYEYLSNNKVQVTDPMENITTTSYLAYGSPSQNKPTLINSPENVSTEIDYNQFGQINTIKQGGYTETRLYDNYQQLCKQVRPETGNVAFNYNEQRQVVWRAENASSNSACDLASVPAGSKTIVSYNNLGDLSSESYPDSALNRSYGYDENGLLTNLIAGATQWNYDYDSAGNVNYEQLTLDNLVFRLGYDYSALGHRKQVTYPSLRVVEYTPNALGLSQSAGEFATDASYHPNGQLHKLTYGNNIKRIIRLDTSGRIDLLEDKLNNRGVISLDSSYDLNDNLDSLIDGIDPNYSLSGFSYDGLNRLNHISGKWGAASFTYDTLGNLLTKSQNGTVLTYHYNSASNLLDSVSGAYNYSFRYDNRGNVTNNGRYILNFNGANQLTNANGNDYLYDGHSRRVKHTNANSSTTYTMYSLTGQLMYQLDQSSGKATDHIYLADKLIAKVNNGLSMPVITVPSNSSDGAITVRWTKVTGATSYELDEKRNDGKWVNKYQGASIQWNVSGYNNADYSYRVRACGLRGCSSYSNSDIVKVIIVPPPVPANIITPTGTDTDGTYTVSWAASNTATSYTLRQSVNGGNWTTVSTSTTTSQAFSGKSNATYRYGISACNSVGCSGYVDSTTFTVLLPPPAPSSISVPTSDYDGRFTVSWGAVSTATRYVLLEKVAGGRWATLNSNLTGTSYQRTSRGSASYQYAIKACNSAGCSTYVYSGYLVNTLMPASVSVPSVDHDGSVTISWASVSTRTRYVLQERTGTGSWATLTSNKTGTSYTSTGRGNNNYQYRVSACNAHGCSGYRYSGTVTVTLLPSLISYATKDHDGNYTVSWARVSTATNYQVQQQVGAGGWATVYTGSGTNTSLTSRADGHYKYRVRACKNSSCSGYRTGSSIWVIRPNLSLHWSPNYLTFPGDSTLIWSATGADYCKNQWIGNSASASGSKNVLVGSTKTETVTCYFGRLNIAKSAKITVKYRGGGGDF